MNRRQFKVYLTNESRIKKVTALLEELGIQNRKMDSKFEFDLESMKNEINYDAVYRVINEKRQSSKQYLKDAVRNGKTMKIGILTHHYVKNYGAFLQMKGMYETLQDYILKQK